MGYDDEKAKVLEEMSIGFRAIFDFCNLGDQVYFCQTMIFWRGE